MEAGSDTSKHWQRPFNPREIAAFFALTFLISWSAWAIFTFSGGEGIMGLFALIFTLGPSLSALIILKASGGSIISWLRKRFVWRVRLGWYAAVLGLPVLVVAATALVYSLAGGAVDLGDVSPQILGILAITFVMHTVVGGGQEEWGWRGFALPRLQGRFSALKASLVLGLFHGLWHLPLFLPGSTQENIAWPPYMVTLMLMAVVFTWVYNNTGSVLLVMMLHGMINTVSHLNLLPSFYIGAMEIPEVPALLELSNLMVWLALAAVLTAVCGRERLSRSPRSTPSADTASP